MRKTIAAYEVVDVLGRGGMGEVLFATHPLLNRPVALKRLVVPAEVDEDKRLEWQERFLREGRALARLTHENVPAAFDLFEFRREMYLALEYIDGFTIAALQKGGALPADIACLVGISVARALEAAHRVGIIHRDIKPANVMVTKGGVVKLMDFGVARDENLETLTETGGVVGTPHYLAPELLKGQVADARSDVYSVGALLYEMLSGQKVFAHARADNIWALVARGSFPRLGKVAPHLPWRLTLLVDRCLRTEPKRRPQSATELRSLLERFLLDHGGPDDSTARLLGWLVALGKLTEGEALTFVDSADVISIVDDVPLRARANPWRLAALSSLFVTLLVSWLLSTIAHHSDIADLLLRR